MVKMTPASLVPQQEQEKSRCQICHFHHRDGHGCKTCFACGQVGHLARACPNRYPHHVTSIKELPVLGCYMPIGLQQLSRGVRAGRIAKPLKPSQAKGIRRCQMCGYHHAPKRKCLTCFKCGKVGHMVKMCPMKHPSSTLALPSTAKDPSQSSGRQYNNRTPTTEEILRATMVILNFLQAKGAM